MKILKLGIANLIIGLLVGLMLGSNISLAAEIHGSAKTGGSGGGSSNETITETNEQTLTCPSNEATHFHTYTNTSGPDDGIWYSARATKFRIYLHDDLMDSVDLDTIECSSGGSWISGCSGTTTADGGTQISYITGDTSSDAEYENYVEWEYGLTDETASPELPGYNDYDGDGIIDTEDEEYRTMGEYFTFDFPVDLSEGSATTTSAIYIKFWYYDVDEGEWYVSEEDGETDYHWNGHTVENITNYECEDQICASLSLDPTTVGVDDLYSTTSFEVTAYDQDGADMTSETEFYWQAEAHDGSTASGVFYNYSSRFGASNPYDWTDDNTLKYGTTSPGDVVTITEYTNQTDCVVEIEYPYCSDLSIDDPGEGYLGTVSDPYEIDINVTVTASDGDPWPYDVTYESTDTDATFDSSTGPYSADPSASVAYYSEDPATVTAAAGYADSSACSASFSYIHPIVTLPDCAILTLTTPVPPISVADMTAGNVEITWESFMTDGTVTTPWLWNVWSTNSSGTFTDTMGITGTGGINTADSTVYYTGTPGDTIYIEWTPDPANAACRAEIPSEEEVEEPWCEGMHFLNDYPYAMDDKEIFDATTVEGQEAMMEESALCFDYWVNIFNSSLTYTGTIVGAGWEDPSLSAYNGTLALDIDQTGGIDAGNPVSLAMDDPTLLEYTGTVCWENFDQGNYLELYVAGEEDNCYLDFEFPKLAAPVCVDLEMTPDSVTMGETDTDAGNIAITVDVGGSASDWGGTLMIEAYDENGDFASYNGSTLTYADGVPDVFSDGHLEYPTISGTSDTAEGYYVSGLAGDTVIAYIQGEEHCSDQFTITQPVPGEDVACYDLSFDVNTVRIEGEGESVDTTLILESDLTGQHLYVQYTGCTDGTIEYDGNSYAGDLDLSLVDGSENFDLTFTNLCAEANIYAFVNGWEEEGCEDSITVTEEEVPVVPEELYCTELYFEDSTLEGLDGDDFETELILDTDLEENTLVVNYEGCDDNGIEVEYDGIGVSGDTQLLVENISAGTTEFEVTFEEVCADAEISAYVAEDPDNCYAELDTEVFEVGEFSKYIFTFNFAEEKNSYSDEDIFFSHDEDRTFYTLEYDPAGGEDELVFTDDMWDGNLIGLNGDGSESDGYVELATSYYDLTHAEVGDVNHTYETIREFGFGSEHEYCSDDLADIVKGYSESNYHTFVPYIKFPGSSYECEDNQSVMIPECHYDSDGELDMDGEVCYESAFTPEDDEKVVIRNAGYVEDLDEDAVIRIRYVGVVFSKLECDNSDDDCLTEQFENDAEVDINGDGDADAEADAHLVVLCSYLITRNAGDVFLEVELEGGSDISCIFTDEDEATSSTYRNTDAIIIYDDSNDDDDDDDDDDEDEEDGEDIPEYTEYTEETVSICDGDESSEGLIGNLSSYVCEIITTVSDLWKSDTVEETTEDRVSQATRNAETLQTSTSNDFSSWDSLVTTLSNQNNPDSGILYFDGDQSSTGTISLDADITVPTGAWTLVVENADLNIEYNIEYGSLDDPTDMPSIAFVVVGGDIHIGNDAHDLVGVYYTDQSFNGDINGDERSAVSGDLTFYGSIYGHIQPLLDAANYVGPATLDGGGIVVRYDSRIILNTPPGLSEYVDIYTEQAVN